MMEAKKYYKTKQMEESIERILIQLDLIMTEMNEIKTRMLRMLHSNLNNDNIGNGINAENESGSLSENSSFDGDGSDPHNIGPNGYDMSESSDSEDIVSENDSMYYVIVSEMY